MASSNGLASVHGRDVAGRDATLIDGLIIGVPGRLLSRLALVRSEHIGSTCIDRVCRVGRSWAGLEVLRDCGIGWPATRPDDG